MTFSPTANIMITAQALSGAAGAVIVPSLVALIAENYEGKQQATALGALGSARAAAGVLAFVIGGVLGTYIGWRPAFGILIVVSAIAFFLSFRLKPDEGPSRGADRYRRRGAGSRRHHPDQLRVQQPESLGPWRCDPRRAVQHLRSVAGADPHRVGIVLGQAFLTWTRRRQEAGKTPLLALEVIEFAAGTRSGLFACSRWSRSRRC